MVVSEINLKSMVENLVILLANTRLSNVNLKSMVENLVILLANTRLSNELASTAYT